MSDEEKIIVLTEFPRIRPCMKVYLYRDAHLLSCAKDTPAIEITIIETEVKGLDENVYVAISCLREDKPLIRKWIEIEINHLCQTYE